MNSLITRPNPREKLVLQSIALVTLGMVFIPVWNVIKKTHLSDVQTLSVARASGPLPSLLSDLYLFLFVSLLAILLAVACAFYLEEWLLQTNWIRRLVENQVGILSGIPSLLYGLLASIIFLPYSGISKPIAATLSVENMDTSSLKTTAFQGDTTLFYAIVLTLVLLVVPRTIKSTQESLRLVPIPIRESAYALGANRSQVLMKHVVPIAFPRVLAGGCRAMSCAFAIAAMFVGIYIWSRTPQSGQGAGIFALFLGGSLLLSILSGFLNERYPTVSI